MKKNFLMLMVIFMITNNSNLIAQSLVPTPTPPACDFIYNGGFEDVSTCGILTASGSPAPPRLGITNNWQMQQGTPDLFSVGSCGFIQDGLDIFSLQSPRGSVNGFSVTEGNFVIGLECNGGYKESIKQLMKNAFQPGKTYKITFLAKIGDALTSISQLSSKISIYSSALNAVSDYSATSTLSTTSGLTYLTDVNINTTPYSTANAWQSYTVTFTFTGSIAQQYIYFGAGLLTIGGVTQSSNFTYLDNISVQESSLNGIDGGNQSICLSTTKTLTNATTGGTWSSSNPLKASIDASTGLVTANAVGTTTITYTVNNATTGCTNTTKINLTIDACCLSSTDTKIAGTAATPAIVSSISYPSKSYYIANDITIQGTVNFTDANVLVAPGVKITVDDNAVFNIASSHFYSCTDMWQGIYTTSSTAKINITSSATRSSLIEDAKEAVSCYFPTGGSSITGKLLSVSNTIFNRNNVSIKINNFQQGVAGTINLPFSYQNTAFTSRNIGFTKATLTWPTVANFITPNSSVPYTLNQIPNTCTLHILTMLNTKIMWQVLI